MTSRVAEATFRERGRKTDTVPRIERAESVATAAVCIALGVVISFFIHPLGLSPRVVLPMHFTVFLAGLLLSPLYAALVGLMTPALSMGLTGMPTPDQALRLMPELLTYGLVTSLILRIWPSWPRLGSRAGRMAAMVTAVVAAMVAGRLVYVLASMAMMGVQRFSCYLSILVVSAIPGIIAQVLIVPPLAYKLEQIRNRPARRTMRSTRNRV